MCSGGGSGEKRHQRHLRKQGAFPPVENLATCLVRAILDDDSVQMFNQAMKCVAPLFEHSVDSHHQSPRICVRGWLRD